MQALVRIAAFAEVDTWPRGQFFPAFSIFPWCCSKPPSKARGKNKIKSAAYGGLNPDFIYINFRSTVQFVAPLRGGVCAPPPHGIHKVVTVLPRGKNPPYGTSTPRARIFFGLEGFRTTPLEANKCVRFGQTLTECWYVGVHGGKA